MALFGGGPPAPRRVRAGRRRPGGGAAAGRRAGRRRSSAASACARTAAGWSPTSAAAQGRPPAEVNAWVNGEVGVGRVQDATIEQLERSIDLLFEALRSAAGRRRAAAR